MKPNSSGQRDRSSFIVRGQRDYRTSSKSCQLTGRAQTAYQNPEREAGQDNHYFFPVISCSITSFSFFSFFEGKTYNLIWISHQNIKHNWLSSVQSQFFDWLRLCFHPECKHGFDFVAQVGRSKSAVFWSTKTKAVKMPVFISHTATGTWPAAPIVQSPGIQIISWLDLNWNFLGDTNLQENQGMVN